MKLNTNSNIYTFVYMTIVVVIVAVLLAVVSATLQPRKDANVLLDKQKQILGALKVDFKDQDPAALYYSLVTDTLKFEKNEVYVGNDDTYGFSGYPLGYRTADGTYTDKADAGFFCTTDVTADANPVYPIFYPLIKGLLDLVPVAKEPRTTCSIRCVKD